MCGSTRLSIALRMYKRTHSFAMCVLHWNACFSERSDHAWRRVATGARACRFLLEVLAVPRHELVMHAETTTYTLCSCGRSCVTPSTACGCLEDGQAGPMWAASLRARRTALRASVAYGARLKPV
jgi:hypothetical protein